MSPERQDGDQAFRSEGLGGREPEMTYGGAVSFLRRKYTRDIAGADIVVSGIPFDMATSNRPGARLGPRAIRATSVGLAELEAYPFGFDPFDHLGDGGLRRLLHGLRPPRRAPWSASRRTPEEILAARRHDGHPRR